MISRITRWMGAWLLGTGSIWGARQFDVPWPVALILGGLIIGVGEMLFEKRNNANDS